MIAQRIEPGDLIEKALCRSLLYDVLRACFSPPGQETLDRLTTPSTPEAISEAALLLGEATRVATQAFLSEAASATAQSIDAEYARLFGHTPHGQIPPYETEYGADDLFRQSEELADLSGFYNGFGLQLGRGRQERPDHVSAECEFLSFLACKEAYERIEDNQDAVLVVLEAERGFLRDHLGKFGMAFASSLENTAQHDFYRASARLLLELLSRDCEELGLEKGPRYLTVRRELEDDVPMACGATCPLLTHDTADLEEGE